MTCQKINHNKKRLLIVVNVDWFFVSHRLPIAVAASEAGYEVHLATEITNSEYTIKRAGITLHNVNFGRNESGIISLARTTKQLADTIRLIEPDLIHLVTLKPVLIGGILARIHSIPAKVVAISGLGAIYSNKIKKKNIRQKLVDLAYKIAMRHRKQKVIFQNPEDRNYLQENCRTIQKDSIIIPGSGVDLIKFTKTPIPTNPPVILFASRLLADKGVWEFVEAAQILKNTNLQFKLVGKTDSASPSSLADKDIAIISNETNVTVCGSREDMPAVIKQATIVVLPSYYGEGIPKILLEAAAAGRPIITTNHPGCRDAIVPGKTGLLVPPRNAQAIANAIRALTSNPEAMNAMSENARALAERYFGIDAVVYKHLEIYDELTGRTKRDEP